MEFGKLSVIMPAYNEEKNIYNNINKVINAIGKFSENFEIIVVNDGSTDNTKYEIIKAVKESKNVKIISYKKNGGKGKAIKKGVLAAEGVYIAFLDADLDLPPEQLEDYLKKMNDSNADAVIGSKMHKDSEIDYPAIRKFISFSYYCMLKLLFRLNVKDTQTGIKLFKAEALKPIIQRIKTKGFAYDIEILVALNSRNCRIVEMPVKLVFSRENGMGRIRFKDITKAFKDTWCIFFRARLQKYYK